MIAFDVADAFAGLVRLEQRSPTLDGSVPLRVAQACVPLLEGNAFGFQVTLGRRVELRRQLGRWRLASFPEHEVVERQHRAALPALAARGWLPKDSRWHERLGGGCLQLRGETTASLWTGLLVRPRAGVRLRQSTVLNRRARSYTVREAILDDETAFCPLVLEVEAAPGCDHVVLEGELATLMPLPARTQLETASLAEAPEVARAHLAFYDAAYFATKQRGEVARKYRRAVPRTKPEEEVAPAGLAVLRTVLAGPSLLEAAGPERRHRSTGVVAGGPPDRLTFRNGVAFSAGFDGYHVTVDSDRTRLAAAAASIRDSWAASGVLPPHQHQGALLYLTKYFTPHPPGEPHLFVKPWSLLSTPPGCSTLIEGVPALPFDVMRGVVRTDSFHATPAVLQLPGASVKKGGVEVPERRKLCDLFALPRSMQGAAFTLRSFQDGPA